MRFHVVGLPYLPTRKEFTACAFTARNWKFCKAMHERGHEVYHYGLEGSDVPCAVHRTILSQEDRLELFGGYDSTQVYYAEKPCVWDPSELPWQLCNAKAAYWIGKNLRRGDFVCLIGGSCQKPIVDALSARDLFLAVEHGIGYLGTFARHRVFDSYAHMHHVYGRESGGLPHGRDGENFDAVIPCLYDLDDFRLQPAPKDYALFVGRMISRKGLDVAVEATRRAGVPLVLAGQGARHDGDRLLCDDGGVYSGHHLRYVGHVDAAARSELMSEARCLLAPTKYLEPFGGVAVEAQLCGTPAITSDFGAFPETVDHGIAGYRCRTLEQWVWAIEHAGELDRAEIGTRARGRYSLARVGTMYEEYFLMLSSLWGDGWYAKRDRQKLDWLNKENLDVSAPHVRQDEPAQLSASAKERHAKAEPVDAERRAP